MQFFIKEVAVVFVGRRGGYDVYKREDGKYDCRMNYWHEQYNSGPGDVIIWKDKGKWRGEIMDTDLIEALGAEIDGG